MRLLVSLATCALVFGACGKSRSAFDDDVVTFCQAIDVHAAPRSFSELAPQFADRLKTDEFKQLFDVSRGSDETVAHMLDRLESAVKRAGVTRCPTLDWMRQPRP